MLNIRKSTIPTRKGWLCMSDNNISSHRTAELLSDEVNTPSTSAMENNENDLQFKIDNAAVNEESSAEKEEQDPQQGSTGSSNVAGEQPAWFDTVRGAALTAKASFPDQIDYYDPEADEIV
jgi:hypothetical protein